MQFVYNFIFAMILIVPFIGLLNSFFTNENFGLQKKINNFTYGTILAFCVLLVILYSFNGINYIRLFSISRNVPIIFSSEPFNLSFGITMAVMIFYLNYLFQDSFNLLNLSDKYVLYNQQIACLYILYIFLSFSHDIVVSLLLYTLVLIYSYFLITNPDLKDFRKDYSIVLTISFISSMIFLCILGFYFIYNGNNLFTFQNISKLENIEIYWLLVILFLLILINLSGPIYFVFKEKFYYEDLLPMLVILIFPFVIFNTFLFTKVLYYVFYNNISNVGLYFYYSGFFLIVIFLLLLFLNFKYIKNGVKFILLFGFLNFIIFFSQFLFLNTAEELAKLYVNFLLLVFGVTISILSYSAVLFELLKLNTTSIGTVYKYSKLKVNLFFIAEFLPIFMNFYSFLSLDFNNFNVLYFINMLELFVLLGVYITHVIITVRKKTNNIEEEKQIIKKLQQGCGIVSDYKIQMTLISVFYTLFSFRSMIMDFISSNTH